MEKKTDSKGVLPLSDSGQAKSELSSNAVRAKRSFPISAPRSRKWLLIPAVMVLIALGGVIGMYFQPPGLQLFFRTTGLEPGGGTDHPLVRAAPKKPESSIFPMPVIKALGRLMPYDDIAVIAPPFGSGDARVAKILVREGQRIEVGGLIAELDNLDQLTSAVNVAEANFSVAEASVSQIEGIVGSSVRDLIAQRESLEEAARIALLDYQRFSDLYKQKSLSRKDLEQSELNWVKARNSLKQTNAQLNRLAGGEKQADIKLALSQLNLAKTNLERAKTELQKAYVLAPKSGTILRLHARVGENPGASGIATLGAIEKMQAELEVYQTDIGKVLPRAKVTLTSPALGVPLYGQVAQIGMEVERQTIIGASPSANLDARIVRVIVDLDSESSVQARSLTGLEVTATVQGNARDRIAD